MVAFVSLFVLLACLLMHSAVCEPLNDPVLKRLQALSPEVSDEQEIYFQSFDSSDNGDGQENAVINTDPNQYVDPNNLRDTLLNSEWIGVGKTETSGRNAMLVLNGFPRVTPDGKPGRRDVARLDANFTDAVPKTWEYAQGMFLMVLLPVVFAFMALFLCLTFCLCRCVGNWCGGRKADRLYTSRDINYVRAGAILVFITLYFAAALGWSANIRISLALNDGFDVFDEAKEFGEEYMSLATSIQELFTFGANVADRLNNTLTDAIPSLNETELLKECVTDIDYLFDVDLAGLKTDLGDLKDSLDVLTNDMPVQDAIVAYEGDISLLPNLTALQLDFNEFNTSLRVVGQPDFDAFDTAAASLTGFSDFGPQDTIDVARVLQDIDAGQAVVESAVSSLNAMEAGVSVFPNATELAINITNSANGVFLLDTLDTFATNFAASGLADSFQDDLLSLQNFTDALLATSLQALAKTVRTTVENGIISFNTGDSANLRTSLTEIRDFIDDTLKVVPLQVRVGDLVGQLSDLDMKLTTLLTELAAADTEVNTVFSGDILTTSKSTLDAFYAEIPDFSCVLAILDQWAIANDTVFALPRAATNPLSATRPDLEFLLNAYYPAANTTAASVNLTAASTALGELISIQDGSNYPDDNDYILELSDLQSRIASISDMQDVYDDMTALTLNNDTQMLIDELLVLEFEVGDIVDTDLMAVNMTLHNISDVLQTIPNIELFINETANLTSAAQGFGAKLDRVRTLVAAADYDTVGINVTESSNFNDALTVLDDAVENRPDSTALLNWLSSYNDSVNGPPDSTEARGKLIRLGNALETLDLDSLNDSVIAMQDGLVSQNSLRAVVVLGEMDALKSKVDDVSSFMDYKTNSNLTAEQAIVTSDVLGPVIDTTLDLDEFLTDIEWNVTITLLHNIGQYNKQIPNLTYVVLEVLDNRDTYIDLRDDMTEFRDEYVAERDELKEDFNDYDGYRLLVMQIIMVLPLCLSLCGICSFVCEIPCPSMLMALLMFPLMSLVFLGSAFQMPAAVLLSDHCIDLDGYINKQLRARTYPSPQFFNLTEDLQLQAYFKYFSDCEGDKPEMFVKLDDPEELMAQNGLNISEMVVDLKRTPAEYELKGDMDEFMVDMNYMWDESARLMGETSDKFACERTAGIYDILKTNFCDDFAPQFALSVCMYMICSLCMCPAVIIGAKGYKRFNPDNHYHDFNAVVAHADDEGPGTHMDNFDSAGPRRPHHHHHHRKRSNQVEW